MGDNSAIEWTDATWNPTTGCTKISEGCRHCYIDRTPLFRIGVASPRGGGEPIPPRRFDSEEVGGTTGVMLHPERIDQPLRWKKPRRVFVNSLSDLFHDDVPMPFIAQVFAAMALAPQHTFQVLTKRPRRMRDLLSNPMFWSSVKGHGLQLAARHHIYNVPLSNYPAPNVWLGTSVEDQKACDLRVPLLVQTPAHVRFLSCEPLLGPVTLPFEEEVDGCSCGAGDSVGPGGPHEPGCGTVEGIAWSRLHWVIVGGESGPQARPMHPDWARSLRDQCTRWGVPYFFKQWGSWSPNADPLIEGGEGGILRKEQRTRRSIYLDAAGVRRTTNELDTFHKPSDWERLVHAGASAKSGGRELDGRTWDEMPGVEVPA